jgi:hypothetical protein
VTSSEPPSPEQGKTDDTTPRGEEPGSPEDALRRLEERLDRASDAAERLFAEAAHSAARAGERLRTPPPSGWQVPEPESEESASRSPRDLELFAQVLESLRELIPPDLQRRLGEALRELLMALRALIDWYIERLERRRAEPAAVQDIPIL